MACMVQFVKGSDCSEEEKTRVLNSRGDERQQYLRQYVAYTVAKSSGRLTSVASHSTVKAQKATVYNWNMFQMTKEVGADVALEWSKKLPYNKDPISRLSTEAHRQYEVPVHWFERTVADTEDMKLEGERKPDKEDAQ